MSTNVYQLRPEQYPIIVILRELLRMTGLGTETQNGGVNRPIMLAISALCDSLYVATTTPVEMETRVNFVALYRLLSQITSPQDLCDSQHLSAHIVAFAKQHRGHRSLDDITPREREVLAHIATGLSNKEIASALILGTRTVETYRERIMKKLDIHDVAGLTRFALAHNLLPNEFLPTTGT